MVDLLDYVGDDATSTVILVTLSILTRVLTGLSSYSGALAIELPTHGHDVPGQTLRAIASRRTQVQEIPRNMGITRRSGTGWS